MSAGVQRRPIGIDLTRWLRALAGMPELPTVSESGVPGYEFESWLGVFAPAGTPRK